MNPQDQNPNIKPQNDFLNAVKTATPEQMDVTSTRSGDVQMNVVNAINANGIVSGRKVVDYIWQRVAICALVIGGGLLIAIVVMLIFMNNLNISETRMRADYNHAQKELNELYSTLGVSDQAAAVKVAGRDEYLNGSDIKQIRALLTKKYGTVSVVDYSAEKVNLVKTNKTYRVAVIQMSNAAGKTKAYLYAKVADGVWQLANYDAADETNPCKNSSDEEKEALTPIIKCPSSNLD
ncbi:hypothetical protein IK110_02810 [Candidatus Saccharibacteria bacterium]|nr:hypothetical protein [Candidatus Saccharibacteria bacterium]